MKFQTAFKCMAVCALLGLSIHSVAGPNVSGLTYTVEVESEFTELNATVVSAKLPEIQVVEFSSGNDLVQRKKPGRTDNHDLVIQRPLGDGTWRNWRKRFIDGVTDRRIVSLVFRDSNNNEVFRTNLLNGWPSKYAIVPGPNGTVCERITIVYEEIEYAVVSAP